VGKLVSGCVEGLDLALVEQKAVSAVVGWRSAGRGHFVHVLPCRSGT